MSKRIQFPKASELYTFHHRWDLHCHTTFADGKHSVKEMIDAAERNGFEVFAITEHVRSSAIKWWKDYITEVQAHRLDRSMQVLIGIEANAIGPKGVVDVPEEMWRDVELVLGSVHGYYEDDTWAKIEGDSLSADAALSYELEKAIGLCHNPRVQVLAHPGWLFERYHFEMPETALRAIFRAARETDTAVELNCWYLKNPKRFLMILRDEDPRVSFGSNAHRIEDMKDTLSHLRKLGL